MSRPLRTATRQAARAIVIGLRRLRAEICELEEMVLPPVPEKEKRRVMALVENWAERF